LYKSLLNQLLLPQLLAIYFFTCQRVSASWSNDQWLYITYMVQYIW
jgi:hypothetical protein